MLISILLFKTIETLVKLWYHESCRVFQDRLVNNDDRQWFDNLLREKMKSDFDKEYFQVVTTDTLIYGDFMNPNADAKLYNEIDDLSNVSAISDVFLLKRIS